MKRWLVRGGFAVALLLGPLAPAALAQLPTACVLVSQNALQTDFADNVPLSSVSPGMVRSLACSVGNLLLTPNGLITTDTVGNYLGALTGGTVASFVPQYANGITLVQGGAPASPVNGQIWITSAGFFYRANGTTTGPVTASGGVITTGSANQLTWYAASGTTLSGLTTANNAVLSTSSGGAPAWSTTLPSGITLPNPSLTGTATYVVLNGTGKFTTAAGAAGGAGLNIPPGGPPTTPVNGDIWTLSTGLFARINGGSQQFAALGLPANFTTLSSTGTFTPSQTNGIVGTTTNNNANAGSVGEFLTQSVSATSYPTGGVSTDIATVTLTAGDWDVWGACQIVTGTTAAIGDGTAYFCSTSTTANLAGPIGSSFSQTGITLGAGSTNYQVPSGLQRISVASSTPVYEVVSYTFSSGSGATIAGQIYARRVR